MLAEWTTEILSLSLCEVMCVEQRAGGSQGSSVWLVQLVLHRPTNAIPPIQPSWLPGVMLTFLPSFSNILSGVSFDLFEISTSFRLILPG